MADPVERTAVVDTLNNDEKNKYYVYALCEITDGGDLVPFYIGKGEGGRVWAHEEGEKKEKEYIEKNVEKEYQEDAINGLSGKYQKIGSLGPDKIEKVIIKWGMTNDEAFMAESALINLLKLGGLKFSAGSNTLTNIANGHSSKGEKLCGYSTKAMPVEQFYKDCAQEPIDFEDLKNTVLISINVGYRACMELDESEQNNGIREMVRGFWRVRDNHPKYLYAMYQQRVVGVYRITKLEEEVQLKRKHKGRTTQKVQKLYTILDVDRADYPISDDLELRKDDYEIAKEICEYCKKNNIDRKKDLDFSKLNPELKRKMEKKLGEPNPDETIDQMFENWMHRKYYVLEDIKETDDDSERREDLGKRIVEYKKNKKTGEIVATSPIPPRNFIRYSKDQTHLQGGQQ